MRQTCEQNITHDKFGMACKSYVCGEPAVDYYITTEYEKFWLCQPHWDAHVRFTNGSSDCDGYCKAWDKEEKRDIEAARKEAGLPPLYDDEGALIP